MALRNAVEFVLGNARVCGWEPAPGATGRAAGAAGEPVGRGDGVGTGLGGGIEDAAGLTVDRLGRAAGDDAVPQPTSTAAMAAASGTPRENPVPFTRHTALTTLPFDDTAL
jgi:hypothetical protein